MKKGLLALMLSTAMVIGLGGTVVSAEEPVKIRVALFTDGADMTDSQKQVFGAFSEEFPEIQPEIEYITSDSYGSNWNGYLMKIQTMIASGNEPDVAALGLEGVAFLAMNNLGLPMDDYIAAHPEEMEAIKYDALSTDLVDIFRVDGKLYGVPYEANSVVTHIRKDIFEQAGVELPKDDWTWDDFKAICEQIKNSDVDAYAFGVPQNFFCLQALLYSEGGAPLNDDWTAAAINSEQVNRVFSFLHDSIWVDEYAPQPSDTITDVEWIVQGKTAMGWWGRWVSDDYNSSEIYDTIYVTNVPAGEAGNTTCAGSAGFIVLNTTDHPDEAIKVALWAAGETYSRVFLNTGSLPANPTWGEEICSEDGIIDNYQVMYDVYNNGTWRRSQDPPEYADLANVYAKYMDIIYSDQEPVDQALNEAAAEIDQIFADSSYRTTEENLAVIDGLFKN